MKAKYATGEMIPWNKGKIGVQVCSDETKIKMSKIRKGKVSWNKGRKHKPETIEFFKNSRKGQNNSMYGRVTYGTGRCQWFDYNSIIAGNVRLQGTYELRMAKALDSLQMRWEKNKDYFPYSEDHSYIPDFKIWNNKNDIFYIDTKGWFSNKDQEKIHVAREKNDLKLIVATKPILEAYERAANALAN